MREFLGIKLEVMFLSKYQLKKLNRKERQEYLTVKKRYTRFEEALKTGMIKHIKNAHEFNKFQHEQDEHYLNDTYDKVINTNYSKIKKKEKKVDKIPVVRETPVVRKERTVEKKRKFVFHGMFAMCVFCILVTFWGYMEPWQRSFEAFVGLSIMMFGGFLPMIITEHHIVNEKVGLLEFLTNTKRGAIIFLIVWAIGMLFLSQLVGNFWK
jgi:IS4 transposase